MRRGARGRERTHLGGSDAFAERPAAATGDRDRAGGRSLRDLVRRHLDQSAGAALAQPEPARARRAFWLTGIAVLILWLAGTAAGWALTGSIDAEAVGLDAAIPAVFVALLVPRLDRPAGRASAIAGAGIALALTPFAAPGLPILAAALGAGAGLLVSARRGAPA